MADKRWSAWELTEAFHLAYAADYIVASRLLDDEERSAGELAAAHGLDPMVVGRMLELLAWRTDLVARGQAGFRIGPGLGPMERAAFDQYVGAYGPNAAALPEILSVTANGRAVVNRERHARAFATAPGPGAALLPGLLGKLGLSKVLDLGCGTGEMLVEMACRDPEFRGYGLDNNPAMIELAIERRRARSIPADQVRFYVGDVTHPTSCLPCDVLDETETIVAASLLNEFFDSPGHAPAWLRTLRETFPGRLFIVADYYGVLGYSPQPPPPRALHDWIQLISSQGVPPSDLDGWESVYQAADCVLLHAIEDSDAGVFVHFVRLEPGH